MTTPFPPVIPITAAMLAVVQQHEPHAPPWRPIFHRTYRGDTIQFPYQVVNRATGGAIDVAGWTFWLTAKFSDVQPDAQAAIAQDNIVGGNGGITLVTPTLGQCLAVVMPYVTKAFPDGPVKMAYDIQSLDLTGVITTIERGEFVVNPDITRSIGTPAWQPKPPPSSPPTVATVMGGGQSYQVKNSDVVIRMDTSNGLQATATLPMPAYLGEIHRFVWINWGAGQVPPIVNANTGAQMVPYSGLSSGAPGGLVTTSTIANTGAVYALEWTGTEWVSI